jgi:EAL domain-containing protein (putative c-di-GMP-specific phosphodiesterase class I)
VPPAEESPLVDALNDTLLRGATEACTRWRAAGLELPIAVNIGAASLLRDELAGQVLTALASCDLPATMLTLEITETALRSASTQRRLWGSVMPMISSAL